MLTGIPDRVSGFRKSASTTDTEPEPYLSELNLFLSRTQQITSYPLSSSTGNNLRAIYPVPPVRRIFIAYTYIIKGITAFLSEGYSGK
jgi:hypothetical protein